MTPTPKEKLYCYVDETGQDPASGIFVVVVVVSAEDQEALRQALMDIEDAAGTGRRKWHKSRSERRLLYLRMVPEGNLICADVFYGVYQKPIPYFFPMLEVLEGAIKSKGQLNTTARVFVDGIDRQKASELTNALRVRGVSLEKVRSRRDESEPMIRLADMWAGCIRAARGGSQAGSADRRFCGPRLFRSPYRHRAVSYRGVQSPASFCFRSIFLYRRASAQAARETHRV
jgi:hypothetical protein